MYELFIESYYYMQTGDLYQIQYIAFLEYQTLDCPTQLISSILELSLIHFSF